MSAPAAIDFTYRYAFPSAVGETERGFGLRLATCGARQEQPYFFEGRLLRPREVGEMLLVLSNVVRTHFFLPRPPNLDPVVTSGDSMLRFEGFSGCCGVYARVDLPAEGFEAERQGHGTTNVEFNTPLRTTLARLGEQDGARLAVGSDRVELERGEQCLVERKVKLPLRWIKGFSDVQLYQPSLTLKVEVSASEARQFLRVLPRVDPPRRPSFAVASGSNLRLSQREARGSVRFSGTHRVKILEPLMTSAKSLRIWADDETGVSGWEVLLKAGRFFLLLSPQVNRGFSGEGQALEKLAGNRWQGALARVERVLHWQSRLDAAELATESGFEVDEISAALAVLGARGLAGFDAHQGAYFHRELPFDLERVEQLQPRLKGARKLLTEGKARILTQSKAGTATEADVEVQGSDTVHLVQLRASGDKCTCPWFSKHLGQRGPCKHVLAARILVEGETSKEEV
jgi:hypothetical protein